MNTQPSGLRRGKFLVVEGIDGVGKSTLVDMLKLQAEAADIELRSVSILRDAGASAEIRAIVTGTQHALHPTSEALLYMAAVLNTYHEKIVPLLEQGVNVVCDRSHISTLAYQVNDQKKQGNELPAELAKIAYRQIRVDAMVLLSGHPQQALERVVRRDGQKDRIESRALEYFEGIQKFYRNYISLAQHPVYHYVNVDGVEQLRGFAEHVFEAFTQ